MVAVRLSLAWSPVLVLVCWLVVVAAGCSGAARPAGRPASAGRGATAAAIARAKRELVAMHGEAQRARIERGVDQVATYWRAGDGDLVAFCREQFVAPPVAVDALLDRLEAELEQVDGHLHELGRSLRWHAEVDTGPTIPLDALLAALDPTAHITEDLFASGVGFAALLNFPLTTLADRLRDGERYDRRRWAEVRLTRRFQSRVPAELIQEVARAGSAADQYIASYNLWMHHVLDERGARRFAKGKRLISHWNLRDELKASYAGGADGALRQRAIVKVMERIVDQSIPLAVIDNPRLDWNPFSNRVSPAPADTIEAEAPPATSTPSGREPDRRYRHLLALFAASRRIDRHSPLAPTALARAFDEAEMSEERVRALLLEVLESPLAARAAGEARRRLGRPLAPQDLWYRFSAAAAPEAELDRLTRARYPTSAAFAADIPRILRDLGFPAARADFLAARIAVDPSRGAGHALFARRRGDKVHLRTRVEPGGMDYKGYNIAVHELGHNVEQVFSLETVDRTLLAGVPSSAFTEALAFLFQAHDLELLGRPRSGDRAERDRVLDAFWSAREIAGAALIELDAWRWLYLHPDATPAELRAAVDRIARAVWKRYFAPSLGGDTPLLAIYSHSIYLPLYLFHYMLGQVIAFQVDRHLSGQDRAGFAREFERVSRIGAVTPDLWMKIATGAPVSTRPLLDATAAALGGTR
jgi:hypothetical protein